MHDENDINRKSMMTTIAAYDMMAVMQMHLHSCLVDLISTLRLMTYHHPSHLYDGSLSGKRYLRRRYSCVETLHRREG